MLKGTFAGSAAGSCSFGAWGDGFKCHTDNQVWCIPHQTTCNGARNCPNGEDEDKDSACLRKYIWLLLHRYIIQNKNK